MSPSTRARDKQLADNVESSARHDERNKIVHWLQGHAEEFDRAEGNPQINRIVALMFRDFANRIHQGDHDK